MNRWAIRVAVLYVVIIVVLTIPTLALAFGDKIAVNFKNTIELYTSWKYGLILLMLFVCQYALLRTPVRVGSRRPVTRGALWPTVLAGGFMVGLMSVGVAASFVESVKFEVSRALPLFVLLSGVISWIVWALLFYRSGKADPARMVSRQSNLLIKGSILELLIAVPMHVIARHRNECCAGLFTFFGLATGVAVMLFAFGPAVFFLYVERWRRLHPEVAGEAR